MVFTEPIQSEKQMETICKGDCAIIFHADILNELGYRDIKRDTEPLVEICYNEKRNYYHILDLTQHGLLKDFSDFKKVPEVKRGIAFYKKGELLLEMKGFDVEKFHKALKMFDEMSPGVKNESCCGCNIIHIQSSGSSDDSIALVFFYEFDGSEISLAKPLDGSPPLIEAASLDKKVSIAEYNSAIYNFARDLYGIDAPTGVLFARFGQFAAYHEGFEKSDFDAKLAKVKMMTRSTLEMFPLEVRAASLRADAVYNTPSAAAETSDDAPASTLQTHSSPGCCIIL
ncbi:hypothetical protein LPJ53_006116 [Coemansia erecta]|uniref:Uncharacterized protein n=1 Tax=Coemansia erecta TaxID=147472 RepID=A0A9W7XU52_9FUNG|nr:hypothetical protein LPJ53_006116 [Coemansia erecta]